jgi:hypothetical protein
MSIFTEAATTRPLFEEPSDAIERTDPWSGPQGFMIGGMALPTKAELGQQYFDAATILIQAIRRGECEDYRLANPALFLYRHWIELTIKSLIGPGIKGHDFRELAGIFESTVKERFGEKVPSWITARLKELAEIDPGSTAFRYAENYDRQRKADVSVDGEIYVDLGNLQAVMTALNAAFVHMRATLRTRMGAL